MITVADASPTDADLAHLARTVELAWLSREAGNHPFGAVLVGADGTVLVEAGNTVGTTGDVTGHAETNLVRLATTTVDRALLPGSTLYSNAEPCAMCAGAIYWARIGRLGYALSERELYDMIGPDDRNPTLLLPSRQVFASGQRPMTVVGPVEMPGAREVHDGFWG